MKNVPSKTREEKIAKDLKNWKLCSGKEGFDEQEMRQLAENIMDRTRDTTARFNHWQALFASPSVIERLPNMRTPTLVIHGGSDVVLPPAHGVATAQAIPDAKCVVIPAMGHVVCKYFYDQLISLITEHHEQMGGRDG
jgi:pimeloyl-ACP methyl ester carboxylesterase